MESKRWLVLIFGIIIIMILLSIFRHSTFKEEVTFTLPGEYSNILKDDAKKEIKVETSYYNSIRNPIVILTYKNQCKLLLFKFNFTSNLSIGKILHQQYVSLPKGFNVYKGHRMGDYDFYFYLDSGKITNHILFSVYGDSLSRSRSNDTSISFVIKFKGIEIMDSEKNHTDFYITKNTFTPANNCDVIFLKKANSFYFVLAIPMSIDDNNIGKIVDQLLN